MTSKADQASVLQALVSSGKTSDEAQRILAAMQPARQTGEDAAAANTQVLLNIF